MRKSNFMFLTWMLLAAVSLQSSAALAANAAALTHPDIEHGQFIYEQGKDDAMACGSCHGAKALGIDSMSAPRLANIGQMYIVKQLTDYASLKRIDGGAGAVMNDISKALNEQDRIDVAAYLDSLDYETEPSDLKALAAAEGKIGRPRKGKIIMTKGIKGLVPPCQDCHGFSGRAPNIPAIHQQKYVYLVSQLNSYRDGSRANDQEVANVGIMRGIAKKLSDDNIADIAAFLSTVTTLTP